MTKKLTITIDESGCKMSAENLTQLEILGLTELIRVRTINEIDGATQAAENKAAANEKTGD